MLLVKTYIDKSEIDNLGVFAVEDILEGTVIWKYNSYIDITLDEETVERLNDVEKEFIKKYAFLDAQTDIFLLSAVNDRFTNHSNNPNSNPNIEGDMIANNNIKKGEEITANYFEIDKFAGEKFS
jgi:SET domain-containing protein